MNKLNQQWREQFNLDASKFASYNHREGRACTDILGWLLLSAVVAVCVFRYTTFTEDELDEEIRYILATLLYNCGWWIVISAFLINACLALMFRGWTECMVGILIVGGLAAQLILIVVLFTNRVWVLLGLTTAWLVVSLAMLTCHQRQPEYSMLLYRVSAYFLTEVPATLWIGIIASAILTFGLGKFFIIDWLLLAAEFNNQMTTSLVVWVFLCVDALMFVYYCTVWIVSDLAVEWHRYTTEGIVVGSCCRLISYHLGSVMLASVLAPPLKLLEIIVKSTKPDYCLVNPCSRAIVCVFGPCFSLVEYYSLICGRSSFLFIALSGKNYFESSRNAGILIYEGRAAYNKLYIASRTLANAVLSICICASVLLGWYLLPGELIYGTGFLGMVVGLVVSIPITVVIDEPVHALYLLDALDNELNKLGISQSMQPLHTVATNLYHQSFQRIKESIAASYLGSLHPLIDNHIREMEAVQYWQYRNQRKEKYYLYSAMLAPPGGGNNAYELMSPQVPSPYPRLDDSAAHATYNQHSFLKKQMPFS